MPPSRSSALLLLSCLLPISAAEPDPPRWTLRFDSGLLSAATQHPPGSLLSDPAAAQAVAHARAQLALAEATWGQPPWATLIANTGAAVVAAWPVAGNDPMEGLALAIALGPAVERLERWLLDDGLGAEGVPVGVGGFSGWDSNGRFAGRRGGTFAMGASARVPAVAALLGPPTAHAQPSAMLTCDLAPLVAAAGRLAEFDPRLEVLGEWSWEWRTWRPSLLASAHPEPGGWAGAVLVDGLHGVRWARLDPAFANLARPDRALTLGAALPPRLLALLVAGALPDAGAALPALADQLTGDLVLQAGGDGPIPRAALVLRCLDGAGAAAALAPVLAPLGAESVTRADAEHAWLLATPAGLVAIAVAGDRLVIGSDDDLVAAWLAGTPGGAAPGGEVLHLRVDLPAFARTWLPVLYALAAGGAVDLGAEPMAILPDLVARFADELRSGVTADAALAAVAAEQAWIEDRRAALQAIFPGVDLPAALAAGGAWYAPPGVSGQVRLVVRMGEGFAMVAEDDLTAGLTAAALDAALRGYERLAGPATADLPLLVQPAAPDLDRRWLPPLAVALAHVPAWRVDIAAHHEEMVIEEHGLPLASLAVAAFTLGAWLEEPRLEAQVLRARWQRTRDAMRERHPLPVAALARVGTALAARRAAGEAVPAKLSELLGPGLTLADLAALAPVAPARAEDLDALGWEGTPKRWPRIHLRVALEGRWEAYLGVDGEVQVSDRLPTARR